VNSGLEIAFPRIHVRANYALIHSLRLKMQRIIP